MTQPTPGREREGRQPSPDDPAEAVLGLYRGESSASGAVLAGLSLDAPRELLDGRTWLGPEDTQIPARTRYQTAH